MLYDQPGTSGILSPFGKIEGLYFNDSREPDDYEFAFKQDIEKIMKADGVKYIEITAENKEDYYRILDKLSELNKNAVVVSGTSRNPLTLIIEDTRENDVDEDGKDDSESEEDVEETEE